MAEYVVRTREVVIVEYTVDASSITEAVALALRGDEALSDMDVLKTERRELLDVETIEDFAARLGFQEQTAFRHLN